MIQILFIGDIVGERGRNVVFNNISSLKEKYSVDLVIANGENSAHGKGITEKIYNQLISSGIDVLTMGNHTFAKAGIYDFINHADDMVRPINMEPYDVGQFYKLVEVKGQTICIYNVLGTIFMTGNEGSPYKTTDKLLKQIKADFYLCDFHGEATSEKAVYAYNYQEQIHAVIGTHTHIQTADERLIGNLAFISDVGMCGVYESVLGRDIQETIDRLIYNENTRFTVAKGPAIFCGLLISLNEETKKAEKVKRIQLRPK